MQLFLGDRADAPQPSYRQSAEKRLLFSVPDYPNAVGFGQTRSNLGDLLARARSDRGNQAGLVAHPSPQPFAERLDVLGHCPGELGRFGERFIERKLFDDGHQAAHGVEYPAAGDPVHHPAWRQHHGRHPNQPAGLMHRHGRSGTVGPRFIARAGHHTSPTQPANQHRPPPQGRPGELFDRGEKRIHVQVQHPAGLHTRDAIWGYRASFRYGDQPQPLPSALADVDLGDNALEIGSPRRERNATAKSGTDFQP
ncbi:Uncharacterised protein [Mycobacterium tuberculosis]|uniref:Uncharacterized protein n=1 Tax=Mycobacterium tuberculosis TaxID=1773 RepID=A0A655IA30_MYCTX|nr:Uncharacterised protein [Mycobacterium tuberculosis]COV69709.1 Uncharacterised protein [Mycobacterium tuberculosis]